MQADGRSDKGAPFCKRGHIKVFAQRNCPECNKIRCAEFKRRHPHYKPVKTHADNVRWFESLSEERKAEFRKKAVARSRQWEIANPERHRANKRRAVSARKARIRAGGKFTPKDFDAVKKRQRQRCFDCGRCDVRLTIGHLVPVCKGGTNDLGNIVAQCMSCNHKQGGRLHPILQGSNHG